MTFRKPPQETDVKAAPDLKMDAISACRPLYRWRTWLPSSPHTNPNISLPPSPPSLSSLRVTPLSSIPNFSFPTNHVDPPKPSLSPFQFSFGGNDSGNNNNNNNNNNNGGWNFNDGNNDNDNGSKENCYAPFVLFFLCSIFCCICQIQLASCAMARNLGEENVWEVKGGKWVKLVPDFDKDSFVVEHGKSLSSLLLSAPDFWVRCRDIVMGLLLPEGFPDSVTGDYLEYSLWRGVQGVASQISGVLATQALLYAVGLGKGAIPTAAAINWVLKDGIGHLSKISLSRYGRHFDVNPKGWRLFADLLENAAFGLEILTPAFPHLFVMIGAVAGAGRSASTLIQAATRSCFYAGFAAQRNFAEVIAKGEAQGMVSKSVGIILGIALANFTGSSTSLALVSFGVVTWVHMFCNLKSYQSIQLRTLNPYRATLVFSEYLLSGQAPSIKEVNDEEPLFHAVPFLNFGPASNVESTVLSPEAKDAAAKIDFRLQLGSKLSDIIKNRKEALALFDLYKNEGYILAEDRGKFCVVLKESSLPLDMLKALFHVSYLYWLEKNAGIKAVSISNDCGHSGRLQMSLDYVQREFDIVKSDIEAMGWVADGLIARPLPNRIRSGSTLTVSNN